MVYIHYDNYVLQDNISELKSKMATNAREHDAKIKQIKEVIYGNVQCLRDITVNLPAGS